MNKCCTTLIRWFVGLFWLFMLGSYGYAQAELQIKNVTASPEVIRKDTEEVAFWFNINQSSKVSIKIYDANNRLIGQSDSSGYLPPGDQLLLWTPILANGKKLPHDVFYYTVTAESKGGREVVYDLTDISGGDTVQLADIQYDPKTEIISYVVPKRARVFLRAGFEQGFVVKTLINGAVREAGRYQEKWNGEDDDGVISLKNHPKLQFVGSGYQLSQNSLVVQNQNDLPQAGAWADMQHPQYRRVGVKPKGKNRHFYHDVNKCRDVELIFSIDGKSAVEPRTHLVSSVIPLKVDLSSEDVLMVESERAEIVFFLDAQMLYENETSYFPYTWNWKVDAFPLGDYRLTAFIVGFNEHFGVVTRKIRISNDD